MSGNLVIDMGRRYWGHNWNVKTDADGILRGFCWLTPGPKVGDRVIWPTAYGSAVGEFAEVRWAGGVDDMYEVSVRVLERVGA